MTEDAKLCRKVLDEALAGTVNRTEAAARLDGALLVPRIRAAFARWIIERQVPVIGTVPSVGIKRLGEVE